MFGYLDRLRKKSNAEKTRAAFFVASLCTFAVIVVWFISLPARLDDITLEPATDDASGEALFGSAQNVRDIVRESELLRGRALPNTGTQETSPEGGAAGTEEVTANDAEEVPQKAIPRQVLVATSSTEKSSEKSE